ncbi:MAG: hypothetical protein IT373_11945 [Polyangiaceae bacterium]|nr:hypothetical protein [Polyangiaceae bacterium]
MNTESITLAAARAAVDQADAAIADAERAYGTSPTDNAWRAVLAAREQKERAELVARAAAVAHEKALEAEREAATAEKRARLAALESAGALKRFRGAVKLLADRVVTVQRELLATRTDAAALVGEFQRIATEAAALRAELGLGTPEDSPRRDGARVSAEIAVALAAAGLEPFFGFLGTPRDERSLLVFVAGILGESTFTPANDREQARYSMAEQIAALLDGSHTARHRAVIAELAHKTKDARDTYEAERAAEQAAREAERQTARARLAARDGAN